MYLLKKCQKCEQLKISKWKLANSSLPTLRKSLQISGIVSPFEIYRELILRSAILIVDADGDGKNELLVGTYDQSLFMFAFASGEDPAGYYDSEVS